MKLSWKHTPALAFLGMMATAQAHHSYAMFDMTRVETIRGTVKAVEWGSPHVWIWLVTTDQQGAVTYGFETISPGELVRFYGWTKSSLGVGDKVTLDYVPLRSGRNGGALRKITLPDGRVLVTPLEGRPQGSGTPAPAKDAAP
jgi:hypothetical protein